MRKSGQEANGRGVEHGGCPGDESREAGSATEILADIAAPLDVPTQAASDKTEAPVIAEPTTTATTFDKNARPQASHPLHAVACPHLRRRRRRRKASPDF